MPNADPPRIYPFGQQLLPVRYRNQQVEGPVSGCKFLGPTAIFLSLALPCAARGESFRDCAGRAYAELGASLPAEEAIRLRGLAKKLRYFRSVVVDVAEDLDRGGFGDIAAGYLTAFDLARAAPAHAPITLAVNARVLGKLSVMAGRTLHSGDFFNGIRILDRQELGRLPPIDLLIGVAGSGVTKEGSDRAIDSGLNPGLRTAVRVQQTTFSGAEVFLGRSEGTVSRGSMNWGVATAGADPGEAGVYFDPVIQLMKGKSREERHAFLARTIAAELPESNPLARLFALPAWRDTKLAVLRQFPAGPTTNGADLFTPYARAWRSAGGRRGRPSSFP